MSIRLPGIQHIGYIRCSYLPPYIAQKASVGYPVHYLTEPTMIECTEATGSYTTTYENEGELESVELSFFTPNELPKVEPLAFVVYTVHREVILIGTLEKPHPIVESTFRTGDNHGGKSGYEVKVTYKNFNAWVKVVK